jgi:hypothetical protein
MSRVPWPEMIVRKPELHLVSGVAADDVAASLLRDIQVLMQRLVRQVGPARHYAAAIVRDGDRPQLQLAFEAETDAERIGARLGAEAADDPAGWASLRLFRLDEAGAASLAASLPPPRPHSKAEPAADAGPVRYGRSGSRRMPRGRSE